MQKKVAVMAAAIFVGAGFTGTALPAQAVSAQAVHHLQCNIAGHAVAIDMTINTYAEPGNIGLTDVKYNTDPGFTANRVEIRRAYENNFSDSRIDWAAGGDTGSPHDVPKSFTTRTPLTTYGYEDWWKMTVWATGGKCDDKVNATG